MELDNAEPVSKVVVCLNILLTSCTKLESVSNDFSIFTIADSDISAFKNLYRIVLSRYTESLAVTVPGDNLRNFHILQRSRPHNAA